MASTEQRAAVHVQPLRGLDAAALPMLNDLVAQSGWNQTGDDWGVFARHGSIGVVRDADGRIVASGAVLPMGAALRGGSVAWISMILVTPALRGGGLGRAVFDRCLRTALDAGHVPMLDATPQGEPLYRQFGFQPLWSITRWRRGPAKVSARELPHDRVDFEPFAALDGQSLGFTRTGVLRELATRAGSRCVRTGAAVGVVREGRIAHQIGPVLATDTASAAAVVGRMADSLPGPLMIDAPDHGAAFAQALADAGFERQRTFVRMALVAPGQHLPRGDTSLIHAIAGPEFA